jgi:eukaryotic-like serine/threonine-protein kinase
MSNQAYMDDQFPRKFGNYHLLAPLAQGGMGALYLAVRGDRGLERLLVIKTVLPHLADAEYIARFRDEAKVVVKLSHGNLIPVFDAGTVDGELFLAMDFVEGRDLRAVWNRCAKKQVAFPIDVAVYIIKELCRGLAYAHSFGGLKLVHRDISPPNILISYSGEVKVTDFGLASSTMKLEKTAPGIIYGKVAYMSPEQARGEPLDGRSDLYASAIVLWELLTGRQLFPPGKDQPHDLIQRAKNPPPVPPSKRAPRVPPELDSIVTRGLAPEREDRYADGEEFRQALSEWLAREAPGTDAARLESFLGELFAEDIVRERDEREALLQKIRKRVETLPPTDELRQMITGEVDAEVDAQLMRAPDSVGRRAGDQGSPPRDRRRRGDRRAGSEGEGAQAGADSPDSSESLPKDGRAAIGKIIDGRYRIIDMIGEGGMGRVYLAEHVEIGRRVAIKILHPVYSRMPELVARFRREARAASKIGNPHIVDVTDSGTTGGSAYFVMEHLEGVELSTVIGREGALDVSRSLRIGVEICQALAAAHEAGIIHRDLKPENIFLTSREDSADFVKVLDFGVATSTETERVQAKRLTTPGMAMGTPEYMAPEQAAGRPANERCDVYAVGAILYEALTGVAPYSGENFMEILTKKATIDPVPVRKLRPELPAEISDLVSRAMARNPDDRPASMEAFEYEMVKLLEGRGAAVAKVLGMSTDPGMMAILNSGLTMREPETSTRRRPATNREFAHEAVTPAGQGGRVEDPFEMDVVESTETFARPLHLRSRSILLGLFVLAALLVAGVGTVLMVAGSDRADRNGELSATVGDPDADGGAMHGGTLANPAGELDGSAPGSDTPDAGTAAKEIPDARQKDPRPGGRPRSGDRLSEAEASALLDRADALANQGNWARARKAYAQVAASDRFLGKAYLGMARASFELGDASGTIEHATKALRNGGGNQARMLIGQGFYKKGEYADALRYFDAVLKRDPGYKGARAAADLARKKLNQ